MNTIATALKHILAVGMPAAAKEAEVRAEPKTGRGDRVAGLASSGRPPLALSYEDCGHRQNASQVEEDNYSSKHVVGCVIEWQNHVRGPLRSARIRKCSFDLVALRRLFGSDRDRHKDKYADREWGEHGSNSPSRAAGCYESSDLKVRTVRGLDDARAWLRPIAICLPFAELMIGSDETTVTQKGPYCRDNDHDRHADSDEYPDSGGLVDLRHVFLPLRKSTECRFFSSSRFGAVA